MNRIDLQDVAEIAQGVCPSIRAYDGAAAAVVAILCAHVKGVENRFVYETWDKAQIESAARQMVLEVQTIAAQAFAFLTSKARPYHRPKDSVDLSRWLKNIEHDLEWVGFGSEGEPWIEPTETEEG